MNFQIKVFFFQAFLHLVCMGGGVWEVLCWEKLNRGVSKPGGFPTFFGKGPDCVADPFGTVPRGCC